MLLLVKESYADSAAASSRKVLHSEVLVQRGGPLSGPALGLRNPVIEDQLSTLEAPLPCDPPKLILVVARGGVGDTILDEPKLD
jgi:hypothetical protein